MERYQTLLTGIMAIAAALIAFGGASAQAKATRDAAIESINHSIRTADAERDERELQAVREAARFRASVYISLANECLFLAEQSHELIHLLDNLPKSTPLTRLFLRRCQLPSITLLNLGWREIMAIEVADAIRVRNLAHRLDVHRALVQDALDAGNVPPDAVTLRPVRASLVEVEGQAKEIGRSCEIRQQPSGAD